VAIVQCQPANKMVVTGDGAILIVYGSLVILNEEVGEFCELIEDVEMER